MTKRKPDPKPGEVVVRQLAIAPRMRRVIAVTGVWVTYSRGGDHVHHCKRSTWHRWARHAAPVG